MKQLLCAVFLIALAAPGALAQETYPRMEIYGGTSYVRDGELDLNGFHTAAAYNIKHWFGIKGDVSGVYGQSTVYSYPSVISVDLSEYAAAAGPQFTIRQGRISAFAHALAGLGRMSGATPRIYGAQVTVTFSAFLLEAGGGVDLRLVDRIALRLVQVDYLSFWPEDGGRNDAVRIGGGIVIRF